MPVIRKNQRDERRRRVLVDDVKPNSNDTSARRSNRRNAVPQNPYAEAALSCNQPRITDLIPTRVFSSVVIFFVGLTVCCLNATVSLLYFDRFQVRFPAAQRLFDLSAPGSFSSWSASVFLLLAAVISTATLWLRRHRIDDYRGRYRIWFLIPVLIVIASVDSIVGITRISVFASAEIQLGFATAKISDLLICFLGIAVGVRLLLEIRSSRAAAALLVSAGVSYMFSFLVSWNAFSFVDGLTDFVSAVSMLTGHWLLTVSLLSNLRYIYLDSQGEIAARQQQKSQRRLQAKKDKEAAAQAKATAVAEKKAAAAEKRAAAAEKKAAAAEKKAVEKETSKTAPADEPESPDVVPLRQAARQQKQNKQASKPKNVAASNTTKSKTESADDDSDTSVQNSGGLSRAERKRLRKEKKKNRRAA